MEKNKKSGIIGGIITVVVIILMAIFGGDKLGVFNGFTTEATYTEECQEVEGLENVQIITGDGCLKTIPEDDSLRVYCLDVGQGDSIYISHKGCSMLIDASTNEMGSTVVSDLEKLGVTKIDYLIGTHAHEDHIGGLDNVIKKFDIGKVVMPKTTNNTSTYKDVLNAVKDKGLKVSNPKVGTKFNIGDAECEVMAVDTNTEDLNETSIVIKMEYKGVSYLFTGDASTQVESSRQWPEIDILKVGHHGSKTSSTKTFLDQIKPKISVISVGKDNSYGHPTKSALNRLEKIGSKIYRTDEKQTILIVEN